MTAYQSQCEYLKNNQHTWLITGVAGFIGSNLLETLLILNQKVIGLDNFATGYQKNLSEVENLVSSQQWKNFNFFEGDICNLKDCRDAVSGVEYVLHQGALGSVVRSIEDPILSNHSNITGFLNILLASKDEEVKSFTYAASSSTYGDHPGLPKTEDIIGSPLSPYAVTKYVNELYAEVFATNYNFHSIGLRYFNVFGKRQDPDGSYAAVIPKWISQMISNQKIYINGDGQTSRDFCFIDNAVQANILAALASNSSKNQVYNIAVNQRTSLNQLFLLIKETLQKNKIFYSYDAIYQDFRLGDVLHSQANISKAQEMMRYNPLDNVQSGLEKAIPWYIQNQ
jgi:UDP-N-acetylglucosamine/UDP-N-acetylgalactosamine 4-epimerase